MNNHVGLEDIEGALEVASSGDGLALLAIAGIFETMDGAETLVGLGQPEKLPPCGVGQVVDGAFTEAIGFIEEGSEGGKGLFRQGGLILDQLGIGERQLRNLAHDDGGDPGFAGGPSQQADSGKPLFAEIDVSDGTAGGHAGEGIADCRVLDAGIRRIQLAVFITMGPEKAFFEGHGSGAVGEERIAHVSMAVDEAGNDDGAGIFKVLDGPDALYGFDRSVPSVEGTASEGLEFRPAEDNR